VNSVVVFLLTRWWEVVGNSELVKSGINRLSNTEWWKEKTSKKMTLQLEVTNTGTLNLGPINTGTKPPVMHLVF
jgi:hypothetical protein